MNTKENGNKLMNEFNDYYDSIFEDIKYNRNINLIDNVYHLRYFVNCWGICQDLLNYLKLTEDELILVLEFCEGKTQIINIKNKLKILNDRKNDKDNRIKNLCKKFQSFIAKQQMICFTTMQGLKNKLSRLSKNDINAKIYRLALEIECNNILAKCKEIYYRDEDIFIKHFDKYKDPFIYNEYYFLYYGQQSYTDAYKFYNKKHKLILKLINLYKENNFIYGYQKSDIKTVDFIIYFELPGGSQISFHIDFSNKELEDIPIYKNNWDGIENSTLIKIENEILSNYEIKQKFKLKENDLDYFIFFNLNTINQLNFEQKFLLYKIQQDLIKNGSGLPDKYININLIL